MYLHFFRLMCRRDIVELQALMVKYVIGCEAIESIVRLTKKDALTLYMFAASKKETHSMIHIFFRLGRIHFAKIGRTPSMSLYVNYSPDLAH